METQMIMVEVAADRGTYKAWCVRIPGDSGWDSKSRVELQEGMFNNGTVHSLRTDKEHRRQGHAMTVMKALEQVAKQKHIRLLQSFIAPNNQASKNLHAKLGYLYVDTFPCRVDREDKAELWIKKLV